MTNGNTGMRLWLLTNTPSPYQVEYFGAIAASDQCDLSVSFLSTVHRGQPWTPPDPPSFNWRELRGIGPRWWSDAFRIHPEAIRAVCRDSYDLFILSGQYTSITFVLCALCLSLLRKPWVMWLEQPWPADYRPSWSTARISIRSPAVRMARDGLLRALLRLSRGAFCIGTAAIEAYRQMGTPETKLHFLPYYCDVERFDHVDPRDAARIRARLGFLDKTVFLYSGAIIERKGVDLLLDAFQKLATHHSQAALIILGDGPIREKLWSSVREDMQSRIHFAGQVSQVDLPAWFKAADIFVFASRHDGWGVVLNEACGAGLPIIATKSTGAARDLVRDDENGKLFPRDDVPRLVAAMLSFLEQPDRIKAFGERSKQMAENFTLAKGVEQLLTNIGSCMPPRSSS